MTIPKLTPYTGQVANPDGSQTQTEFTQNMFDQLSYEAQLATQLDATIDGMNNAVDEVETNAASAENSANAAEAAASSTGYQGLWPDTGGSALKGEVWQTQAGGAPTGEYYTALQNTTVDPVGDNVNWKVNISASNVRNPNLLSNGQFKFTSPDNSLPAPSSIPQDYPAGFQIFSGWFADDVNGASGVTRVNDILNWTQDGVSSIYTLVPKDGDLTEYTASLAGKVAGAITAPDTSHVSFSDNGDGNWRITIANSATDIYSCKFELGSVATGHEVQSYRGQSYTFNSVAEMVLIGAPVGSSVGWDGYYSPGDGGGNSGVVKSGPHVEDGGSIFSIDSNTYVEALTEDFHFKKWGGQSGVSASGNKDIFDRYKEFCIANNSAIYFDFSKGEVYRFTETIDFEFTPTGGNNPEILGCSSYTFSESGLKGCLYLDGMAVSALNVSRASDIGFVCNRLVNGDSTIRHTRRLSVWFDNVEIWHGGNHNLELPYGAIPLKIKSGIIDRAQVDNILIQNQDDGQGNPDFDTNICILDSARLGFPGRHNFNWEATGGVTKITNGTDITKAGEPTGNDGSGSINTNAYGIRIINQSGTNSQTLEIDNAWMEKNYNMIQIQGVFRNINIRNIRSAAFVANQGLMLSLAGFVYDLNVSNISGSGPLYQYALDVSSFSTDNGPGFSCINRVNIEPSAFWAQSWLDTSTPEATNFIRRVGGFFLEEYAAATVTSVSPSGDLFVYSVDTSNIPSGSATTPITNQSSWFFNVGQASDVSLYIDGTYAGEIQTSTASSWTTNRNVAIGDGSASLYVKRKVYLENQIPSSYSQSFGFV